MNKILKRSLLIAMMLVAIRITAQEEKPPALVKLAKVQKQRLAPTTKQVGTTYFSSTSNLSTEIPGLATEVHIEEGQVVQQGSLLVRIDTSILAKEIAIQKAKISEKTTEIEYEQKRMDRISSLKQKNAISEDTYDEQYYKLLQLKRALDQEEKQFELLELKMKKCTIYAPFDAVVLEKNSDQGDWLTQGSRIARLGRVDSLRLQVPVFETYLKYFKDSMPIEMTITASGITTEGIYEGLRPEADTRTKNVYIKIKLPHSIPLVENMSATVQIPIGPARDVLTISRDAVITSPQGKVVYTVAEGKAISLPISVEKFTESHAVISGPGITENLPLVIDGNERLQPGQSVMETK